MTRSHLRVAFLPTTEPDHLSQQLTRSPTPVTAAPIFATGTTLAASIRECWERAQYVKGNMLLQRSGSRLQRTLKVSALRH
jgi:hypothetical protein